MRRKLIAVFSAFVLVSVMVTPAYAQSIRIRGATFSFGSLKASGQVVIIHTAPENVKLFIHASGLAEVTCVKGHRSVPVGHLVQVEAVGLVRISRHAFNHNGVANFNVTTGKSHILESYVCGHGWKPKVGFVFWDHASLEAESLSTHLTVENDYVCETTPECVFCEKVSGPH
jgi:hypothetical protein